MPKITLPWLSTRFRVETKNVGRLLIQTDRTLWFVDRDGNKQGPYRAKLNPSKGILKTTSTVAKRKYLTIDGEVYENMGGQLDENGKGTGLLQIHSPLKSNANWSSDGGR